MKKKNFTSWGVSFASLALVAGMMSYLGITNKDTISKTKTAAQSQVTTQNSTEASQSENNQNSAVINENQDQASNDNGSQSSMDQSNSIDHSFSGHHGNFDTTTGGT